MNIIIALIIGILFASSIYLMLHQSFFRLILGIIIFGYATIFFLFVIGGVTENSPALLGGKLPSSISELADPLPQALTLTAIVISIGVQLFLIVLLKRVYSATGTDDLDELNVTDDLDKKLK
ncbi:MAG: NADH-quinone oxidoreductase subunit K [Cyclobacteriaceae bacterium]